MTKIKRMCMGILASAMIFTSIPVNAAVESASSTTTLSSESITNGQTLVKKSMDNEGNECSIQIQEVPSLSRAASRTWTVSYSSGFLTCSFNMVVSGNKCTKVYNKKIRTIACTYSGDRLTRTTKYGRLTADISGLKNSIKFNGWLQGKVTGKNNNINVSWSW